MLLLSRRNKACIKTVNGKRRAHTSSLVVERGTRFFLLDLQ